MLVHSPWVDIRFQTRPMERDQPILKAPTYMYPWKWKRTIDIMIMIMIIIMIMIMMMMMMIIIIKFFFLSFLFFLIVFSFFFFPLTKLPKWRWATVNNFMLVLYIVVMVMYFLQIPSKYQISIVQVPPTPSWCQHSKKKCHLHASTTMPPVDLDSTASSWSATAAAVAPRDGFFALGLRRRSSGRGGLPWLERLEVVKQKTGVHWNGGILTYISCMDTGLM